VGKTLAVLKGQVLVAGSVAGQAICSDVPLSFWGGVNPATGEVIDRRHPLFGRVLTGKVLVLPHGRGSCSASGVLFESIHNVTAPSAILVSHVDPIIALGSILGDEIYQQPIPLILISEDERAEIPNDAFIRVDVDGSVTVTEIEQKQKPEAG
jgi:predicted aconitase with swiveling domain